MYVDGFIVPVPKKNVAHYKKVATLCGKVWKEHGALEYLECLADDVKKGKWTSFPRSVKLKPNEVVFFSYITYRSRAHRDSVNKKVFNDPRMKGMMTEDIAIFDGKRMIYGGFKPIVSL